VSESYRKTHTMKSQWANPVVKLIGRPGPGPGGRFRLFFLLSPH
jgi:hypothetical protein